MKLLVQSDDYGITKAVSLGCIEAIQNGIVKNTGMFANMPWIEECVEYIKPYLNHIAFGIDLNISTGPSILGHEQLPFLTKENGDFYTSRENRSFDTPENQYDHLKNHKDEVYKELKAQIEKYISLVGHKPDYIHNHAYGTATIDEVTRQLSKEYGVICSVRLMDWDKINQPTMDWYVMGDAQKQIEEDLISYILEDQGKLLQHEYGYMISHCGYVDAPLFKLTSFHTCRAMDLYAMTSPQIKKWVLENNIELITFKDLPQTLI